MGGGEGSSKIKNVDIFFTQKISLPSGKFTLQIYN